MSTSQLSQTVTLSGFSPNIGIRRGILISGKEIFYVDGPAPERPRQEFWLAAIGLLLVFWPGLIIMLLKYNRRRSDQELQQTWGALERGDIEMLRGARACTVLDLETVERTNSWAPICNQRRTRIFFVAEGQGGRKRVVIRHPQEDIETIRRACGLLGDPFG